jgi:hypothetical protein
LKQLEKQAEQAIVPPQEPWFVLIDRRPNVRRFFIDVGGGEWVQQLVLGSRSIEYMFQTTE